MVRILFRCTAGTNSGMKFSDESIHTSTPQKNHAWLGAVSMSQAPALCHVAQSFKNICHLSLQLTPSITLTCPSMPEGASPALAWLLDVSPVSLWSQRHIYQSGFCWGFTPWTTLGRAKRTQQEHITRGREAVSEGLFFLQGTGCQISCERPHPHWAILSVKQPVRKPESWKILSYQCDIDVFHSTYPHTRL